MMFRKNKNCKLSVSFSILFSLFISCNSHFTPKPKGYFKIDLPQHAYQRFDEPGFPYSFEYPVYAEVSKEADTTGNNPYWININFKDFNGRIYLSYKSINGRSVYKVKTDKGYRDSMVVNNFENLREESYKMTYKHTIKASGIVDSFFTSEAGSGVYFYVAGEAATSKQFYVSDSSKHFLRGALYFDASPNEDSLSAVSNFLESDIRHMLKTLKWK
jgi:gliding motility-associated lipoprotein GldD